MVTVSYPSGEDGHVLLGFGVPSASASAFANLVW